MNAPSPGVIALFQPNEHYATLDEYLDALADAMKVEYEGIVNGGLPAADRRAGPRDGPPHHVPRPARRRVRGGDRAAHRGDQPRARRRARRAGAPARLLGQLRGPAPPRHPGRADHGPDPRGQAVDDPVRGRQPAPRARVGRVAGRVDPRRQDPRARRHLVDARTTSSTPSSSPSGSRRSPSIVGPDRVVAGTDCGFGTWSGFGPIDPTICWAKLETLAEGARLASSRLF